MPAPTRSTAPVPIFATAEKLADPGLTDTRVPVRPIPDASVASVPVRSSNRYQTCSAGSAAPPPSPSRPAAPDPPPAAAAPVPAPPPFADAPPLPLDPPPPVPLDAPAAPGV